MIILIIQFVILIITTQNISCLPIEFVITVLIIQNDSLRDAHYSRDMEKIDNIIGNCPDKSYALVSVFI